MSAAVRTDGPAMARSVRETVMRNAGANEQARTLNVETVEALWNCRETRFWVVSRTRRESRTRDVSAGQRSDLSRNWAG